MFSDSFGCKNITEILAGRSPKLFYSFPRQIKTFSRRADSKRRKNLDWIITDWTHFFFLIDVFSLSIAKKISTAENRHCQINWNTTTVTDRVPLYLSWKVCKKSWAFASAQDCITRLQQLVTLAQVEEHRNVTILWTKFPLSGP